MIFRDFVELVRDGLETVAFTLQDERDITPMLHLESADGIDTVPVDPDFFASSTNAQLLATRFVIPLIEQDRVRKVAWTFCAWSAPDDGAARPHEHPDRRELLLATFIDAEVIEHWAAPIVRPGGQVVIGNWSSSLVNVGGGAMLTAIQQALR